MRPPKYTSIYDTLKKEIAAGKFQYGRNFPSDNELSLRFDVARETLRRALDVLEDEHLIARAQGRRTRICFRGSSEEQKFLLVHPVDTIGGTYERIAAEAGMISLPLNQFRNFSPQETDEWLSLNQISGIILCGNHFFSSETVFDSLNQLNIPIVLMLAAESDFRFNRFSGIRLDLRRYWEAALSWLHRHGYRRVATCAVPDMCKIRDIPIGEYPAVLRKKGLSDDPRLIFRSQWLRNQNYLNNPEPYYEEIAAEVTRMLNLPNPPDAFLCFNDHWAPPVYQAIAAAGKKIPDDFGVMGFLSGMEELVLEPGLTTVRLDFKSVLLKAKELLQNPASERQIIPADISLCKKESICSREPLIIERKESF